MIKLPTDLPRQFRYQLRVSFRFSSWDYSYELIGARGGMHLHVAGPHHYDGQDHYSAGLETHLRAPWPRHEEQAPSHDECWLLKCPCWHDGTSSYAQDVYLPLVLAGNHATVFRMLSNEALKRLGPSCVWVSE